MKLCCMPCTATRDGLRCRQAEALAAIGAAPDKVVFLDAPPAALMERAQRASSCEDELLARLDTWDRLQRCVLLETAPCRPMIEYTMYLILFFRRVLASERT